MNTTAASDPAFARLSHWLHQRAGIVLTPAKQPMVLGRLGRRFVVLGCADLAAYVARVIDGGDTAEAELALDLLTTNETYFFREPAHFTFLAQQILPALATQDCVRVWSAACSSGEEPCSLAMLLDNHRGARDWQLLATDVSQRMLEMARRGIYPLTRTQHIPLAYLQAYCQRGVGARDGMLRVAPALRQRIEYRMLNLLEALPPFPPQDVILLRNVMIYFDAETKRQVIERLVARLRPGGWLLVGHAESLHGLGLPPDLLDSVRPSIHRRRGAAHAAS